MTSSELQSLTVLQLRKLAKEHHIKLSAGIDKAGIIERLTEGLALEQTSMFPADAGTETAEPAPDLPADEASEDAVPDGDDADGGLAEEIIADLSDAQEEAEIPAEDAEDGADQSSGGEGGENDSDEQSAAPAVPRFSSRPAYQAPNGGAPHPGGWMGVSPSGRQMSVEQRVQPMRPGTSTPRFGPAMPAASRAPGHPVSDHGPVVTDPSARSMMSVLPERRFGPDAGVPVHASASRTAPSYPAAPARPAGESPAAPAAPAAPAVPDDSALPPVQSEDSAATPTLEEILASGDYIEGEGILELHPDGYGFLRAAHFLPSSRDVYLSVAQIRRFGLRTGDLVKGKIRPQREGDKYAAMLYITSVNDIETSEANTRPLFEELTPTYPTRRISLESKKAQSPTDMRLVDLIAPLGFGQRALILCPPNTGKTNILRDFAGIISENYPEAEMLMLLIDVNPEDVTLMRDQVSCQVLASTFDQAPEAHLRLSEVVLDRAMRLVELKKDVILIVDSLTRLAKIYTTAAAQQGRSMPGMVNPTSLFRAKRLFGAARACKEGGSLTVIATMDIGTGSKVDDSVVEEFKGTANMELTLDAAVARAGISPAINLAHSFTKNSDILLDQRQKEGLSLIRQMLAGTSSATAIPQLISMMDKAPRNADLLLKMKDWFALMNR